ncbi:hypothetical protein MRX96_041469 [Rhipicephalus microplus]
MFNRTDKHLDYHESVVFHLGNGDIQWCFSQVKGTLDDDVTEADIISCVEFNHDGDLLATGRQGWPGCHLSARPCVAAKPA